MSSDDEQPLPSVPRRLASPFAPPISTAPLRKRSRGCDSSTSSDTPLFSSDDLGDASLDNYSTPRPKRLNRQKWWEEEHAHRMRKRHLKRRADPVHDSGVFMASDGSFSSDDGFNIENLPVRGHQRQITQVAIPKTPENPIQESWSDRATHIISACLEHSSEVVDLSNLALTTLSSDTIRPLHDMVCLAKNQYHPNTEESYRRLAPMLKLILSNNRLRYAPREVVNLEHLTVLSLRNNKLEELPHSMGKLVNLVELNIAGNRLKWLPAEILQLLSHGKLSILHARPNPLIQASPSVQTPFTVKIAPEDPASENNMASFRKHLNNTLGLDKDSRQRFNWILHIKEQLAETFTTQYVLTHFHDSAEALRLSQRCSILLGSTPVTHFDLDGSLLARSQLAPSQLPDSVTILPVVGHDSLLQPMSTSIGRVPSLLELTAQACASYLAIPKDGELLESQLPDNVARILTQARDVVEEGGRPCSICRKSFVIPRAEWIEYWHCWLDSVNCSIDELCLPFLRRTCSWACAQERASPRTVS